MSGGATDPAGENVPEWMRKSAGRIYRVGYVEELEEIARLVDHWWTGTWGGQSHEEIEQRREERMYEICRRINALGIQGGG